MADLHSVGPGVLVEVLQQVTAASPLTAALFTLVLGDTRHLPLGSVLRRFLRNALIGESEEIGVAMVEGAHALGTRCADLCAYLLDIVLDELNETAPYRHLCQ